jgi:hypothetical protein
MHSLLPWLVVASTSLGALPGPYAPAADEPGSTAIPADDERFIRWATGYSSFTRGPQDISGEVTGTKLASWGTPEAALGRADEDGEGYETPGAARLVVSLGDGGSITLTFDQPFGNGPGADFAVFENAFTDEFLELAFVEVSSDGSSFHKFAAVSLTQTTTQATQADTSSLLDATNIHNLAGKYRRGFGTPFDLEELAGRAGLDIMAITHVRITDAVGSIDEAYARHDSLGNIINDPWRTPFDNGGFDLDAVGVINVPEPGAAAMLLSAGLGFFAIRRRLRQA